MGTKKTNTTKNETATTTPNLAPYAQGPVENYFEQTGGLLGSNWSPFTGSNPILNNVFASANNLTPGNDYIKTAAGNTMNAIGNVPYALNRTLTGATLGGPSYASDPTMGQASMDRVTVGDPAKVDLSGVLGGYKANTAEQGIMAGGGQATGGRASTYWMDYLNPMLDGVVNTTLNDYDINAGKQRAAYASDAAKRGAFGGSRVALGESALEGELARGRAATDANLRFGAYDKAYGYGAGDADRETSASIATANNATQASVANANNDAQRLMFNAGEQNKFGLQGQRIAGDAAMANAGFARDYGLAQFGADRDMALARYEQDSLNNRQQYTTLADLSKFNADAGNEFSLEKYRTDTSNNQLAFREQAQTDRTNADLQSEYYRQLLDQAGQLGDLGGLLNTGTYNATNQQIDIGKILRDIESDANMAPAEKLATIKELITGGGLLNTTTGQTINSNMTGTSKESGGLLGQILGAAAQVGSAAMMSDIRVKRDVVKLAEEPDGLGVYRYNYIWDDETEMPRFGVMAQEVAILRPWALGPETDGVMTVRYDLLEAAE